jgi:hypothetical protein
MSFVTRHGRRIEIIDQPDVKPKKKRKPFKADGYNSPRDGLRHCGSRVG